MSEEIAEAATPLAHQFTALPRWVRTAIAAVFIAECALLTAGLMRDAPNAGLVRIDLHSARPAPGFSSL